MKQWFRFENTDADPSTVDIHIIDYIGGWREDWFNRNFGYELALTARAFVDELSKLSDSVKTIRVHINSPGGDVFGAINIANALRDQVRSKGRTVETINAGLAASAATIVLMSGSTVTMSDNAMVMIHDPMTDIFGNAAELRTAADELEKLRNTIVATYQWHSTLEPAALIDMMKATTWMDADEAIANGFATQKVEGMKAVASLRRDAVAKLAVPEKFKARVDALRAPEQTKPVAAAATDVLTLCEEAGCVDIARSLIAAGATTDQVKAKVESEKTARAESKTRADRITALCAKAKLPGIAAQLTNSQMSLEDVNGVLLTMKAALDKVEIDGGLNPDGGTKSKPSVNVAQVYADRNAGSSTHKEKERS